MPTISLERVDTGTGIPRLNVVFLHGLGGDPISTWCHSGGRDDGYFWPKWIAQDLPDAAVWTVGYPADKAAWGTGWPVVDAATAVLDKLMSSQAFRATGDAPIAFVCHSLGGIIAKKLVVTAHLDREQQPAKGAFLDRIAGIVFLATPHGGSILATIASTAHWFVSSSTTDLTASNAALLDLGHSYRDRVANGEARIRHRVYYEGKGVWGAEVVTSASADPGLPGVRPVKVERDHIRISKPIGKEDVVYEGVLTFLRDEALQPRPPSQYQKVDKLQATVEQLVTLLAENRALVAQLTDAKVDRAKVVALARRTAEHVTDFDQAYAELESRVRVAIEVSREGRVDSNLGTFVDAVLARVRKAYDANDFDRAAAEADRGFAEWERNEAERREEAKAAGLRILEAGLQQDILRRDPVAAARRIEQRLVLEGRTGSDLFAALRAVWAEWCERGRDKGLNFDLGVSIELARICLARAASSDNRGAALNSLGIALATLGERESGTARLEEAVAAYRAALEERTRARVPLDWAMTQNNLGTALKTLGERESGTARLEQAVAAYRAALDEWTRERQPYAWATTQNNLGNVLQVLGEREIGTRRLKRAIAAYRRALDEFTRERVPLDWAMTQNNLGNALSRLGLRQSGTTRLRKAVSAYQAALEEYTRERFPLDWAMTKSNVGNTLRLLGERESGKEGIRHLDEAVEAFQAALNEYTRERVPLQWARTQNNLGNALQMLGARASGQDRQIERLEAAIAAYRAALEELRRELVPIDWAMSLSGQGEALRRLAERRGDVALARQALDQIEAAHASFAEARHAYGESFYRQQADLARALVALLEGR